jgi:hypothetical protein
VAGCGSLVSRCPVQCLLRERLGGRAASLPLAVVGFAALVVAGFG